MPRAAGCERHAPNVPGLIRLTLKSKNQAEQVLVTVYAVETRRNNGGKNK